MRMLEDNDLTEPGSGCSAHAGTALLPIGFSMEIPADHCTVGQKPLAARPGHFEAPTDERETIA